MSHTREKKIQNHDLIFEFEYSINPNLKLKCGFSTTMKFKPIIWFQYKKKDYIALTREIWNHLMTLKYYVQLRLEQHDFFDSFNLLNETSIEDIEFDFQTKDGSCYLVLNQNGHQIKIDSETWRSITRISIFLTTFVCWNNILQKQISYFYHNFYIPTCLRLKKTYIQVNDIKGFHEKEVEIDLTRLCFEFGKKMESKIKQDVKVYKLLTQINNNK